MALERFLKAVKNIEEQYQKKAGGPKEAPAHDESNWLVSYADMMTLLCVFFIMLFTLSNMNEPQYEKSREELARQFGGDYKSPTAELARFVTQVVQEAGLEKETVVKSDGAGVSITFRSTVFFDTLSSEVRSEGQAVLAKLITTVSDRQTAEMKQYKVVVEGHTDARPVLGGVYPSNWELSGARAARVVRMFLEKGFSPKRLTAIGYADTFPEASGRTPAGTWDDEALAKNRRVVIRILEPRVKTIPYPESPEDTAPDPAVSAH